jgi:lysophospholipase L1-like esterase
MTSPSPTRSRRRRRILLATLVAVAGTAIVVAGTAAHTAGPSHHSVVAAARLDHSPSPRSSANAARSADPSAPPSIRDVLFVGASYTAGLGASPSTNGYAYDIGREPGWRTQVYGVSGTGFLNPGPRGNETFAERIAHLPTRPRPDFVVFQGGRNDVGYPPADLRAAAIKTAELTRKRFAGAQVIFLGPIPAHVPAPPEQLAVAATLRAAAVSSKAIFIDPIAQSWITPRNESGFAGHVPAHPDNSGYAYIAQQLLENLRGLSATHGDA